MPEHMYIFFFFHHHFSSIYLHKNRFITSIAQMSKHNIYLATIIHFCYKNYPYKDLFVCMIDNNNCWLLINYSFGMKYS